jgi:rSAM/selenodomain-associated transferase 2
MITVIIPTLNEAENLSALLDRLLAEPGLHEIIVVDGGSEDGTQQVALSNGVHLIPSPTGRGPQLRNGAEAALGEILLFLHADCGFPEGGLHRIEDVLEKQPSVIGGNHELAFDGPDRFSRWLTGFYAWIRSHGVYYGDSGIFVRRQVFDQIGGIRPLELMEDFDFVRRMERHGETVCMDERPLVTSSRRFAGRRPVAIVWEWLRIHALYYLGVSPARLARLYNSERRTDMFPDPEKLN